jgi:hypothetical protein
VPPRPNPLTPFPAREGGKFGRVLPSTSGRGRGEANPATSGTQAAGESEAHEGGGNGGPGGEAPWQGVWGMCPQELKLGANSLPLQPRYEWDQKRWQAQSPRGWAKGGPGGLGDVPPKFSKKGKAANSYYPATSGTQNPGEPSASEGGQNGGSRGRSLLPK